MGKSTISMAIFNSKLLVHQRVVGIYIFLNLLAELTGNFDSRNEIDTWTLLLWPEEDGSHG